MHNLLIATISILQASGKHDVQYTSNHAINKYDILIYDIKE